MADAVNIINSVKKERFIQNMIRLENMLLRENKLLTNREAIEY
jgi:hypothetical protein